MNTDYTITEQDRDDAMESITLSKSIWAPELAAIAELDKHRLQHNDSVNLGYYRTFVECSCGVGFWYGEHEGDPSQENRWDIHRAEVIRGFTS